MFEPIPILLYHRVDRSGARFSTAPEVFDQHLAWLAGHGYRTMTLGELERLLDDGTDPGRGRSVVITFDDGFADLETTIAPALRRHDYRGVAFLITSRCGDVTTAGDEQLSWAAARSLAAEGRFEFHSHSHTHQRWDLDRTGDVAADLATSLSLLSDRLEQPASVFNHLAWPYGRSCDTWEEAAHDLGLRIQYSVQRGAVTRDDRSRRLPRLLADGMSAAELGRWVRLLSSRRGALASNRVFGSIRQLRQGTSYS
jgi:peptidoglycan/xylan/chitin deacetylase (PgdA/CDA1 family)